MSINEIVVISGKGGTGKTTLVASLVPFLGDVVIADCDVDAPDLNILFGEKIKESRNFVGLMRPVIDYDKCIICGKCYESCKFKGITENIHVNISKCEGCGLCEYVCPVKAIDMKDYVVGSVLKSDTNYGLMVHGKLIPGEETSGKLVSQVRKEAKIEAEQREINTLIIDGSPGIACNVIASITGARKVIIVIEPTMSGLHDLERVHKLVEKFSSEIMVVINKSTLSEKGVRLIRKYCDENSLRIGLVIPFNKNIVKAIAEKKIPSIAEEKFFQEIGFFKFAEELKNSV